MGFLDDKFLVPPELRDVPQNTETPPVEEGSVQPEAVVETPTTEVPPTGDTFFDGFNKRFSTQYKTDDEIKGIFEQAKRAADLEGKYKTLEEKANKVSEYEKQIEDLRNAGNSELLSRPRLRKAFVVDQLVEKYPDKDPEAIQEIVMADVDKMGDLDVLVAKSKIDLPGFTKEDHLAAIRKDLGVDPDIDPKEWDSVTKLTVARQARMARQEIKSLASGIELPKAVTKEEREQAEAQALQRRTESTSSWKKDFTNFSSYEDAKLGDLKSWEIPSEFKSKLDQMFDGYVLSAGMDDTPENRESLTMFRNALLVYEELPKLLEAAKKVGIASVQKKVDAELHNDTPPNTTTATDNLTENRELPGKSLAEAFGLR